MIFQCKFALALEADRLTNDEPIYTWNQIGTIARLNA